MAGKITIDFYKVTVPGGNTLHDISATLSKRPTGEHRNYEFNGTPVRLQEGGKTVGDICAGDMIRMQMDGFPIDAGLDGSAKRIKLEKDHGLGHETAFLFYIPWGILLLQRNRSGVAASAMARYFEAKGNLTQPIEILPIPLNYADAKLGRMKRIRTARIRVASASRVTAHQNANASVASVLDFLGSVSAPATSTPVVDIKITMEGPRKDSLETGPLISLIRALKKVPADIARIERLDVTGSATEEGALETLHYLDFFLTDEQPVKSVDRGMPYHQREAALHEAFKKHKAQLEKVYAPPKVAT